MFNVFSKINWGGPIGNAAVLAGLIQGWLDGLANSLSLYPP